MRNIVLFDFDTQLNDLYYVLEGQEKIRATLRVGVVERLIALALICVCYEQEDMLARLDRTYAKVMESIDHLPSAEFIQKSLEATTNALADTLFDIDELTDDDESFGFSHFTGTGTIAAHKFTGRYDDN